MTLEAQFIEWRDKWIENYICNNDGVEPDEDDLLYAAYLAGQMLGLREGRISAYESISRMGQLTKEGL